MFASKPGNGRSKSSPLSRSVSRFNPGELMAQLSLKHEQKLQQRLVMTPQMQQSIKLLQMTTQELEQLATLEVMENPFLELVEEGEEDEADRGQAEEVPDDPGGEDGESLEEAPGGDEGKAEGDDQPDTMVPSQDAIGETSEPENPAPDIGDFDPAQAEHFSDVDVNWDDFYDGAENHVYTARDPDEEERDFQEFVAPPQSLYDTLRWQLHVSGLTTAEQAIGEYIIGSIDDDGYLRISLDEVAAATRCTVAEVGRVLRIVQTFDPPGVGARNLAECLRIQLEAQGEKDPLVLRVVDDFLDLLHKKKFREIAKAIGVDESRINAVSHRIARLEPIPGRSRSSDEARYVIPDVTVREIDGRYMILLNEGRVSGLRLNGYYRELLSTGAGFSDAEKEFAQDKLKSAVWLLRNIERRKSTILKVSEAVMDFQRDFLDKGTKGLRPLTLKQIAEVVGMHESTVARVTTGKYIDTPRGIYELKYFFSPGLETASGEDASSTSIKEMLAQMIAAENPRRPLSDQKLTDMLQEKGITIARRTVAKYREQLKILTAKLRKQVN